MSIEQTNQLILLILNSVLMTLLSSLLLGGAWLRQNALLRQLNKTRANYRKLTRSPALGPAIRQPINTEISKQTAELKQVRDRRAHINEQYQWSRIGTLMLHATLLIFCVSLFALALRSLLAFDRLIAMALFLFTIGAACLLIGVGCILIDFAKGNSSDDALGQTLANILQQRSQQWSLTSHKPRLGLTARSIQPSAPQHRSGKTSSPAKSSVNPGQAASQQISS